MKLGVNVDHIATLRQTRKTRYPDPVHAAVLAEKAGADQITVHLREDRRHIQDRDIRLLSETVETRLNLEIALNADVIEIAKEIHPHRVTFVPEKREELTTEGGLNLLKMEEAMMDACQIFRKMEIETAMFIEADTNQIDSCRRIGADSVELHTGSFATAYDEKDPRWRDHLSRLAEAASYAHSADFNVYAGHGLNIRNITPIVSIEFIEELNIGHSIIARACFIGLEEAVREMKTLIRRQIVPRS